MSRATVKMTLISSDCDFVLAPLHDIVQLIRKVPIVTGGMERGVCPFSWDLKINIDSFIISIVLL